MPDKPRQLPAAGPRIDPEYFLKRYRDIGDKENLFHKARSALKAEIETAAATGINKKALKLVEKLRKMEPREAQSLIRDAVLYMRLLGLNILDQEELLEPSTTGLTEHIIGTHAAWEAGRAGYAAGKEGRPIDDNPFRPGTETHQHWASEWLDGHDDAESQATPGTTDIQPRDHNGENPEDSDDQLP